MAFSNYTLVDLAGTMVAIVMFFPLLFIPGYVGGWITNCFAFRQLTPRWRVVLAIPLSMAVSPAAIYWCSGFFGWTGVSVLLLLALLMWVWIMLGNSGHERWTMWLRDITEVRRGIWLTGLAWLLIVLASLVDVQIGHRLYFSATAYDHSVRTAITDTIARVGSHPNNPFYYLTGPVPLRYHYFWLLPCGFLTYLAHGLTSARTCMYASVVWCGWGFMALIPVTFRFLLGFEGAALRRRSYLAIALTSVTGLDLFPIAYEYYKGTVYPDMEWWSNNQVTSFWDSALWVPHHFAALVIGITGFLICWSARNTVGRRRMIASAVLAGVGFGSLVGCSIYVAVVMAAFLTIWTGVVLFRRETRHVLTLVIAGCLAIAIAVPYLHSLAGEGEGGPFITFAVRHFSPVDDYVWAHDLGRTWSIFLRLLWTPLHFFVELGFFFVVGIVFLWRIRATRRLSQPFWVTVLLASTSLFIAIFFKSGVITNNDLGMRGFLPAQFVLLLWAADMFSGYLAPENRARRGWRSALPKWGWALLLVLGTGATFYQVGMLRVHGMLADKGLIKPWYTHDRQLGERAYALRHAYDLARTQMGINAVLQNTPKWKYEDFYFGLYSHRQTAAYNATCGAEFGGDPQACAAKLPLLTDLFDNPEAYDLAGVSRLCKDLKINFLVIKDHDGIWEHEPNWLKSLPVLAANAHARIVAVPPEPRGQPATALGTNNAAMVNGPNGVGHTFPRSE